MSQYIPHIYSLRGMIEHKRIIIRWTYEMGKRVWFDFLITFQRKWKINHSKKLKETWRWNCRHAQKRFFMFIFMRTIYLFQWHCIGIDFVLKSIYISFLSLFRYSCKVAFNFISVHFCPQIICKWHIFCCGWF